jgi:hypothetical protein
MGHRPATWEFIFPVHWPDGLRASDPLHSGGLGERRFDTRLSSAIHRNRFEHDGCKQRLSRLPMGKALVTPSRDNCLGGWL